MRGDTLSACEPNTGLIDSNGNGNPLETSKPPDVNVSLDPMSVFLPSGETAQFTVAMQGDKITRLPLDVLGLGPQRRLRAAEALLAHGPQMPAQERSEFVGVIKGELDYMQRLIEDLFFIADLQEPRYTQKAQDIDLVAAVNGLNPFDVPLPDPQTSHCYLRR